MQNELLHVSEREQQRIGRELHDSLGQHLHALFYLATLLHAGLSETASPRAAEAARLSRLLEEALALTRGLAHGLQPVKPVPEGLMIALRDLAARTRELYRVDCRFDCRAAVRVAGNTAATHLYRIAQEAVNNALKHAQPTRVRIALSATPRRIVLRVKDNGVGLRPARRPRAKGMGLQIMQYRADAIDASFAVQALPQGGTEVLCSVPLEAIPPDADPSK